VYPVPGAFVEKVNYAADQVGKNNDADGNLVFVSDKKYHHQIGENYYGLVA
jgi:hypothetical protein